MKLAPTPRARGWVVSIGMAGVLVAYLIGASPEIVSDRETGLQGEVVMRYCSSESTPNCQPGVAEIELTFRTRNPWLASQYGYGVEETATIKVQDITLRLSASSSSVFPDGTEIRLYSDSDGDGELTDQDNALALGLLKGKRIIFEDLNQVLHSESVVNSLILSHRYFAVWPGGRFREVNIENDGETESARFFKGVEVGVRDLLADNMKVPVEGVFADLSLFDRLDELGLSRDVVLANYPFAKPGSIEREIVVGPGVIEINRTVVISEGLILTISPGTTLRLGPDVSFISYSPTTMVGTLTAPIIIEASQTEPFGVFGIIGTTGQLESSTLSHVFASGGSEASVNGAFLSGMVSIYRIAHVSVDHSTFTNAQADDALNIKYSEIDLRDNLFDTNSADGFDGDFVTGAIVDNEFVGNGNDSVDLSGSTVVIQGNSLRDSGDKGISVGEATTASISFNLIESSAIGIQFKDSSTGIVDHNLIAGSREAGLNAYIKKSFFDAPTFEYFDNVFLQNGDAISGLVDPSQLVRNVIASELESSRTTVPWLDDLLRQHGH